MANIEFPLVEDTTPVVQDPLDLFSFTQSANAAGFNVDPTTGDLIPMQLPAAHVIDLSQGFTTSNPTVQSSSLAHPIIPLPASSPQQTTAPIAPVVTPVATAPTQQNFSSVLLWLLLGAAAIALID